MSWFRMHDAQPNGVIAMPREEAKDWNSRGHGIFWTPNQFRGPRRIENLEAIRFWAIDMDEGSKEDQRARIKRGLTPTRIIETKRGYQCYWRAKDATAKNWNHVVLERLVPFYGADKNARDLARILRVPGFLHLKDPADPFLVREAYRSECAYMESQMLRFYPSAAEQAESRARHDAARRECHTEGDAFFERLYNLDCVAALERLSGHGAVSGERFSFKRNRSGTHNILVNGKGTSCWIDPHGRIGSFAKGGPTILQWIKFYGHSTKGAVRVVKQVFPELEANG